MPKASGPIIPCRKCGTPFATSGTGRTVNCPSCRGSAPKTQEAPPPRPGEAGWSCPVCGGVGHEPTGKPCANATCNRQRGLTGRDFQERLQEWQATRDTLPFTDRRG